MSSLCALSGAFIGLWADGIFGQPRLDPLHRSVFEYHPLANIVAVYPSTQTESRFRRPDSNSLFTVANESTAPTVLYGR